MNIFSAKEIYEWEKYTKNQSMISSLQLMERAAKCCTIWIANHFSNSSDILLFCGSGNNGGDGFALARLLYHPGFNIKIFTDQTQDFTEEALINLQRCKDISGIEIYDLSQRKEISTDKNTLIIDALFGLGLNRKLVDPIASLIIYLNTLNCRKISIDLPSGLFPDSIHEENAVVFLADYTLTFQCWKKTMLHPETAFYCGSIQIMEIDLSAEFCLDNSTFENTIDDTLIKKIYQPRKDFSHKGTFGKSLIIAGTFGKIGASVLATKAALKSGSGITFVLAPKCGYEILQTSCPEAMFILGGENHIDHIEIEEDYVIGIGPGLEVNSATEKVFLKFLKNSKKPMVIDADALNILAKNPEYLNSLPPNSVITPHPKEFERLFGATENSFGRLKLAQQKAAEFKIFIILKDHHTQIVTPDQRVFYNLTGNSGMAKGGSGDALLGIVTSLIAQNYSPENAAIFGVWLHGKAGDLAAEKFSKEAMLPSDLIDELGNAFKFLI
ncbi:NAD(P)H-hydrate dehydratase [Kaistella polysaccharea]|uniref:NAD(P)H-hydrate dehydratase n=1 Tax=Kaistella polysaccharea TaxID=2878534 RepID=UPI001CF3E41D|nr:NAD(P)H-hydrate dehydratase [Kaistella polysaccharea]